MAELQFSSGMGWAGMSRSKIGGHPYNFVVVFFMKSLIRVMLSLFETIIRLS